MSKKTHYVQKSFRNSEKVTHRIGDAIDTSEMDDKRLKFYLHHNMISEIKPAGPKETKPAKPKAIKKVKGKAS